MSIKLNQLSSDTEKKILEEFEIDYQGECVYDKKFWDYQDYVDTF